MFNGCSVVGQWLVTGGLVVGLLALGTQVQDVERKTPVLNSGTAAFCAFSGWLVVG